MVYIEQETINKDNLWDFIKDNVEYLTEQEETVSINSDLDIQILVGIDEDGDAYLVSRTMDDIEIERLYIRSEYEAQEAFEEFQLAYVPDVSEEAYDDVYEREWELSSLVEDMLYSFIGEVPNKDLVEDIKDRIFQLLSDNYPEYRLYRPMVLTVNGEDVYSQYPYEEYSFK